MVDNGWHPHICTFCSSSTAPTSPRTNSTSSESGSGNAGATTYRKTLGREIHGIYGVDARPVRDINGVGDYVSKIHFEMVRGDLKTHRQNETKGGSRTPMAGRHRRGPHRRRRGHRLLAGIRHSDARARRSSASPRVIRDRYGTAVTTDTTDEDLAAQTQDATDEAALSNELYGTARRHRINGESVIARAVIALEDHGPRAMATQLEADLGQRVVVERRIGRVPLIRFLSTKAERLLAATAPTSSQVGDIIRARRGIGERRLW